MCLIVDTNCIPLVFNIKAQGHPRFAPVYSWFKSKHGRLVYGGTKYAKELKPMATYHRLFQEYERQGKVIKLKDAEVDRFARIAKAKEKKKAFNDEHLVGIVAASHCRILCTDDTTAIPFLKDKRLYQQGKPPKIYSQKGHWKLCCLDNIAPICRPSK